MSSVAIAAATGNLVLFAACAVVFAETGLLFGFFLPGDELVFLTAVLCASGKAIGVFGQGCPAWMVVSMIAVAAFVGDQVGFLLGRTIGRTSRLQQWPFFIRRVERAKIFFSQHGGWAIVLARFVPWVRTFVPFVAGVSAYDHRRFLGFNALGAGLWAALIATSGYYLGTVPWISRNVGTVFVAIAVLSVCGLGLGLWRRRQRAAAVHRVLR